jgi:redox-sensitive bicupin YhaK (pirin superfamily)
VILGELAGAVSPARAYTPMVGAEIALSGQFELPLPTDFEYAVLALSGSASVDGTQLDPGPLLYPGTGRSALALQGEARLLLLGGEPFEEQIVIRLAMRLPGPFRVG